MKVSIFATFGIVLIGLMVGLRYQNSISAVREHRRALVANAEKIGALPADLTGRRMTKRVRSDPSQALRSALNELDQLARKLKPYESGTATSSLNWKELTESLIAKISVLDPRDLTRVMREIRDSTAISATHRHDLFGWILLNLESYDPETLAKAAVESFELTKESLEGEVALTLSLARWTVEDPSTATAWLLEASKANQKMLDDGFMESVVNCIASMNPRLALTMMSTLGVKDVPQTVQSIMEEALSDPEKRNVALDALRGHLAGMPREADRVGIRDAGFAALAGGLHGESFQKSTEWLESTNLSGPELAAFATGLGFSQTGGETSQWIGWLSNHLDMNDLNEPVAELMTDWTRNDYIAAGQWLATAAESAGKRAAVAAYAETVAGTEPQTAVQWALTLPDTWRREAVMRAIHENWPATDPQGAAAFADEQGIK